MPYFVSLAWLVLLFVFFVFGSNYSSSTEKAPEMRPKPPKLVLISFDGFRADYVNSSLTPNLQKLASDGVLGTMESMFVTKTFPNHMSIVTGVYEDVHGVVHNQMFDPLFNETFSWRNTESKWWDNGVTLPLWLANERYNDNLARYSGVVMWPGSGTKFKGQLSTHVRIYNHTMNWEDRIDEVISWMTDVHEPANSVFIYFDEPDTTAHIFGPFSKQVLDQVKRADNIMGYFMKRLREKGLLLDTNLIVLSDHGMVEVTSEKVVELDSFIDRSFYSMYGSSPVFGLLPKPGHEEYVYQTLKTQSAKNHFTIYKKEEVPEAYHYRHNRRIMSLVIEAEEGWEIAANKSQLVHSSLLYGNHGYNSSLPSMRPLFIAKGPVFREKYVHKKRFFNVDLYPLICFILELFPLNHFPSNGSMSAVSDMLISISRTVPVTADHWMPVFMVFGFGFTVIILGGTCLVLCAGCGKSSSRKDELNWDPGVTDFDLDQGSKSKANGFSRRRILPEEAVLLLEDGDDEEL